MAARLAVAMGIDSAGQWAALKVVDWVVWKVEKKAGERAELKA